MTFVYRNDAKPSVSCGSDFFTGRWACTELSLPPYFPENHHSAFERQWSSEAFGRSYATEQVSLAYMGSNCSSDSTAVLNLSEVASSISESQGRTHKNVSYLFSQ